MIYVIVRSGWSLSCTTLDSVSLCEDMLKCLLEVIIDKRYDAHFTYIS